MYLILACVSKFENFNSCNHFPILPSYNAVPKNGPKGELKKKTTKKIVVEQRRKKPEVLKNSQLRVAWSWTSEIISQEEGEKKGENRRLPANIQSSSFLSPKNYSPYVNKLTPSTKRDSTKKTMNLFWPECYKNFSLWYVIVIQFENYELWSLQIVVKLIDFVVYSFR